MKISNLRLTIYLLLSMAGIFAWILLLSWLAGVR